jgi:hypothetical protein
MREDLGALIAFDLGVPVAVYPGYRCERRQFLPVDCETIEYASFALTHLKRGHAQHSPGNITLIYGFGAELA